MTIFQRKHFLALALTLYCYHCNCKPRQDFGLKDWGDENNISFNRDYTGVTFNPHEFMKDNRLPMILNTAGLEVLTRKLHSQFDHIVVPLFDPITSNDLVLEMIALQNLYAWSHQPARVTVRCIFEGFDIHRVEQIRTFAQSANTIFNGTVREILLTAENVTARQTLQQFVQFRKQLREGTKENNYQIGMSLALAHCLDPHPMSPSGFAHWRNLLERTDMDVLYFLTGIANGDSESETSRSLASHKDIFGVCKELVTRLAPRTEVHFSAGLQVTSGNYKTGSSNLVYLSKGFTAWSKKTNARVVLVQAFNTPFSPLKEFRMNGWWHLVPNSSYEDPSQFKFREKYYQTPLHDGGPTSSKNIDGAIARLKKKTNFRRSHAGVLYNIEVLYIGYGGDNYEYAEVNQSLVINTISQTFSKIMLGFNYDLAPLAPFIVRTLSLLGLITDTVAKVNLERRRTNKDAPLVETILNFESNTFYNITMLAKQANSICPGTVTLLLYISPDFYSNGLEITEQVFTSVKRLDDEQIGLGIQIPALLLSQRDFTLEKVMTLVNRHNLSAIYITEFVSPDQARLGVDAIVPLFTTLFENCLKSARRYLKSSVTVGFFTQWPIADQTELDSLLDFLTFWERMDGWAAGRNTTIIFSNALDFAEKFKIKSGWWRLTQDHKIFEIKKDALKLAETMQTTSLGIIKISGIGILAFLLVSVTVTAVCYFLQRRRQSQTLTELQMEELLKSGQADSEELERVCKSSHDELAKNCFSVDEGSPLGSGAFGTVCQGTVRKAGGGGNVEPVAVKMTKSKSSRTALRALLFEIKILSYLGRQDHIVRLVGASTSNWRKGKVFVFLEMCSLGSLYGYLRKVRPPPGIDIDNNCEGEEEDSETGGSFPVCGALDESLVSDMLSWSAEIASGLEFIASKNIVHADIATRNVLLTQDKRAKISDFGLSRRLYDYQTYVKKHQEPLPWRWMAPEALRKSEFTEKSDVWAFGVTLWEIFTLGDEPYPGMSYDVNFPTKLERGLRLGSPTYNRDSMFSVMLRCWATNPERRPTFAELLTSFRQYLTKYEQPAADEEEGSPGTSGNLDCIDEGLERNRTSIKCRSSYVGDENRIENGNHQKKKAVSGRMCCKNLNWRWAWIGVVAFLVAASIIVPVVYILTRPDFDQTPTEKQMLNLSDGGDGWEQNTNGSSRTTLDHVPLKFAESITPTAPIWEIQMDDAIFENSNEVNYSSVPYLEFGESDEYGSSQLHIAAHNGTIQLVQELISKGADLNATNEKLETPLHIAASKVRLNIIKLLISQGANPFPKDKLNCTFLHTLLYAKPKPTLNDFHSLASFLIGKGYLPLFGVPGGKRGSTPIQLAMNYLYLEEKTLSLVLSSGLVDINAVDAKGDSLLFYAVKSDESQQTLGTLIRLGANYSHVNNYKASLLHYAVTFSGVENLNFFIDLGLNVNWVDEDRDTPLHLTLMNGEQNMLEVTKCLLESNASINSRNRDGETPLHKSADGNADFQTSLSAIHYLIDKGAEVYATDKDGDLFLHTWIGKGTTPSQFHEIGKLLVGKQHSILFNANGRAPDGITPLQKAVKIMEVGNATLTLLLQTGAVNINKMDTNKNNVFYYAIVGGRSTSFLTMLVDSGANYTQLNNYDENLLHIAAQHDNFAALNFFLQLGLDVNGPDILRNTPLHYALRFWGDEETVLEVARMLVDKGADVNAQNTDLETALHYGVTKHIHVGVNLTLELIQFLMESGAQAFRTQNKGLTFLHLLLASGSQITTHQFYHLAEYLIGKNYSKLFTIPGGKEEMTPLHNAVSLIEVDNATLNLLHKNGVTFNATDKKGASILFYAVRGGRSLKLLCNLVQFGADWEHLTHQNQSLLHYAAKAGHLEGLTFFLNKGLDVNGIDGLGNSPLHHLAKYGTTISVIEVAEELVNKGANVTIKNGEGLTPKQIVLKRKNFRSQKELLNLLTEAEAKAGKLLQ